MTNEQAKAILTEYLDMDSDVNSEYLEAMRAAVKALEQQLSEDCIGRADMLDAIGHGNTYNSEELAEIIKRLPSVTPKPKSGDCISRAQALHACCDEWNKDYKDIMKSIRRLPSVTPKPKSESCVFEEVGNDNE